MRVKSLLSLVVLVGSMAAAVPAAMADTLDTIRNKGEIRVAIDLGAPPFGMIDEQMKPTGSDVEIATMLAADLGAKLNIVEVSGPNRVPFLLNDRADIVISSFSITEERKKVIDFTIPYSAMRLVLAAPVGSTFNSLDDLVGVRVAVVRGNLQDVILSEKAPSGTEIVRYDDDAIAFTSVVSKQTAATATSYGGMLAVNKRNPDAQLEARFDIALQPLGIGVRKGEDKLREWLDQWIATNVENGKLGEIYTRYMDGVLPGVEELKAL